eukprot:CAMPEP_0119183874 /NCGR_PEP_ID=MMETSP1315-20130426/65199_1 /TAXON_ID=676789 /ORGANISM="Prasinoderma singularis, Strain RCC927" /LENGTH=34 /DNA_ID= /DNA_START= /DNA_END= /DNA_ORIENTATION=
MTRPKALAAAMASPMSEPTLNSPERTSSSTPSAP